MVFRFFWFIGFGVDRLGLCFEGLDVGFGLSCGVGEAERLSCGLVWAMGEYLVCVDHLVDATPCVTYLNLRDT